MEILTGPFTQIQDKGKCWVSYEIQINNLTLLYSIC